MKSLLGKIGTLALVGMAGVAVAACSSSLDTKTPGDGSAQHDENIGSVGLRLQPVKGITVANVHYTVTKTNPATTPVPAPADIVSEGNLPTPGTADNFSFGIPLPVSPVGTPGYYISLSGESAELGDNITCTGSYGAFTVNANTSTVFNMVLTCVDNSNGQVLTTVDVKTDACPRLVVDYAVAEPSTSKIPGTIAVFSTAHDLDNPAEVITYAWEIVDPTKAGVGSFAAATANTSFACAGAGDAVRIKVTATNHECSKSLETVVSCVNDTCGNGVVDTNLPIPETCDFGAGPGHPADPTCPADCTKVCGDGNAEGDETCDPVPSNPALCIPAGQPGACTATVAVCGDGLVTTPAEVCDTMGNLGAGGQPLPAGSTCLPGCTTIQGPAPVVCGDGAATGTEQCDNGTGTTAAPVPAPSRECSPQCERVATTACVDCEQAGNCVASSDNCLGPAATPFTFAQVTTCYDVTQCIQDSNCLDGTGTLGSCYCGTLGTAACGAATFGPGTLPNGMPDLTRPNGPCAAIMVAGSPSLTTNSAILGGLTAKSRPGGAAGQRLNCQKNDATCAPICGVQ